MVSSFSFQTLLKGKNMDSKSYVQKLRLSNTSKLKAEKISSFSIPAYKTISGIITCIGALFCIALCYARQGTYTWSSVKALRESNYFLSLESNFVASMKSLLQSYKNDILRLHDSGDFYSTEYYAKWCEICSSFPMKTFYAYTKSLSIIDIELKPKNLVLIQSYGGKFDNLINLK